MSIEENQNAVVSFMNALPPTVQASIMGACVAVVRVMYDQEETKPMRIIMEGVICGFLCITVSHGIKALGLDENWIRFSGAPLAILDLTQ